MLVIESDYTSQRGFLEFTDQASVKHALFLTRFRQGQRLPICVTSVVLNLCNSVPCLTLFYLLQLEAHTSAMTSTITASTCQRASI